MQDRTILISGANSGIGYAAAEALAKKKAQIVMLCRDEKRGEAARQQIIRKTGNDQILLMQCDLLSQKDIYRFAAAFNERFDRLDVLYNNAGANFFKRSETPEGVEFNFLINYLAHFLITHLLLDKLKVSTPSRVINITGMYHTKGHIDFKDIQLRKNFNPMQAANNAQLAKVLFTYELARRLQGTGVTANCFHPGAVRTPLQRKLPWYYRILAVPLSFFFRNPVKGAQTAVWLASSPEVAAVSGKYFFDRKAIPSSEESYDEEKGKQLWRLSEEMAT